MNISQEIHDYFVFLPFLLQILMATTSLFQPSDVFVLLLLAFCAFRPAILNLLFQFTPLL